MNQERTVCYLNLDFHPVTREIVNIVKNISGNIIILSTYLEEMIFL